MASPSRALPRDIAAFCLAFALALGAQAADPPATAKAAGDGDAMRALLAESKDKGRGVSIYANGATIQAVVVAMEDRYVIAKNRESGRIVIRLDRIDGVASQF
jgi:hypothetical protein